MNVLLALGTSFFLLVSDRLLGAEEFADELLPEKMKVPALSKFSAKDYFLALPGKVLPLLGEEKAAALAKGGIIQWGAGWEATVTWDGGNMTTAARVVAYTREYRPILDVIYSKRNPGMSLKWDHERYLCVRLAKGWRVVRVSLGKDPQLDKLNKWDDLGDAGKGP